MSKPDGAAIEAAALRPDFGNPPNVFVDFETYAIDPGEFGIGEVRQTLVVKFARPGSQEWVRCHPAPERVRYFNCLREQRERKLFVVHPSLCSVLGPQIRRYRVTQAITTDGVSYLWPAPASSAMESDQAHFGAQQLALKQWTRTEWDGRSFGVCTPEIDFGEPPWPDLPFSEILTLALSGHYIDSPGHPLIRRLQGLA
jgi:hypothetical protein